MSASFTLHDNASKMRRDAWGGGKLLGWIDARALDKLSKAHPNIQVVGAILRFAPFTPWGTFPEYTHE